MVHKTQKLGPPKLLLICYCSEILYFKKKKKSYSLPLSKENDFSTWDLFNTKFKGFLIFVDRVPKQKIQLQLEGLPRKPS